MGMEASTQMLRRLGGMLCAVALLASLSTACSAQNVLAPTPPMGWNSWDSYGLTINEEQFRANVDVMAKRLKAAGYQYAVVDEGWYLPNPQKQKTEALSTAWMRMAATSLR